MPASPHGAVAKREQTVPAHQCANSEAAAGCCALPVKEDAAHAGVLAQQRGEEEALAAANVRHGAVRVLCPVVLLPSRRAQGGSLGGQNPLEGAHTGG